MPFGSSQWMYSSGGFYPTEIDQSLMFDGTSYLTRTPSVAGNRTTWTYSSWFKRWSLTPAAGGQSLFYAGDTTVSPRGGIVFGDAGDDKLSINGVPFNSTTLVLSLVTTAQYRDPSAWYHLVVALDTTQATASDRCKMYVNGVQVTAFGTATYPSLNQELQYNDAILHATRHPSGDYKFVGYLADTYFVDGTALDPTSFGEFKSGVWIPKAYTGSYGTNGFHLEYDGNANDSSGTGNNWTATNIVAGDYMLDSPTNNYCTFNPLVAPSGRTAISEGNLTVVGTSSTESGNDYATIGVSSGKWYWENAIITNSSASSYPNPGAVQVLQGNSNASSIGSSITKGFGIFRSGAVYKEGSLITTTTSFAAGDIVGIALNLDDLEATFYKNGTLIYTLTSLTAGTYWAGVASYYNSKASLNFDQSGFTYTPPDGFLALSTANLPEPSISPLYGASPQDHFNTVLYTGNGGTQTVTGVGFEPDFTWVKQRSDATSHWLNDAVRGAGLSLASDTTEEEKSYAAYFTAFNSDGFALAGGTGGFNNNASTYAAWNWKASNATAVSNTEGTITSQVSANTTAGFSIVSFTGPVSSSTVGHGLGVAPSMIILKNRDIGTAGYVWLVYHQSLGNTKAVFLNTTGAETANTQYWLNTTPTSTVFSVGSAIITGAEKMIAYCFADVEGYSKFGSYTGNGSADGTFVYTGFRPAFVIAKRTDSANSWTIQDNKRDLDNPVEKYLLADDSGAEGTSGLDFDFLSNGFKLRTTSAAVNASSGAYIYMAFAENPFKYSVAR
jgi:hypothetical protein